MSNREHLFAQIAESLGSGESEAVEGTFTLENADEDVLENYQPTEEITTENTGFFAALADKAEKIEEELAKEDQEEDDEDPEETPKAKAPTEEEKIKSLYNFTDTEIKAAVHGLLKQTEFKKTYDIYPGFSITVKKGGDLETGILNKTFADIVSEGEKRTSVKIIDASVDKEGNAIPGGRIEEEWNFNPDGDRLQMRAMTAIYIVSMGPLQFSPLPKNINEGVKALRQRMSQLDEYSTELLDRIFNKIIKPFEALMKEAEKKLLNF